MNTGMFRMVGAFIVVLLTNVTVLLGIIASVYWVDLQTHPSWVARWRPQIKVALGAVFLAYLYTESWINNNMGPQVYGYHWAYMNMLAVTIFLVVTGSRRWWQLVGVDAIVCLYAWARTVHNGPAVWISLLLVLACTTVDYLWRDWTRQSRFVQYGLLLLTGAAAVMLNHAMLVNESFTVVPGFWLRQWLGLLILGVVALEYSTTLINALENTRELARNARVDGLTQLNNFNAFNEALVQHFTEYEEHKQGYSVFELDVDWFKRINDTYGHLAGNRVLATVARGLSNCTAGAPWPAKAYRLGGEEFGVIMDVALNPHQAAAAAEHFKHRVEAMRFNSVDPQLKITVSIGQANVHDSHYSFNDAYKQADRNLYRAKQSGRDRIVIEDPELVK